MSLVKVTSKLRDGKAYVKDLLVDLEKLTQPVSENISGEAIIMIDESPGIQAGVTVVQYIINESLAQFLALNTKEAFSGTVVSRDGRDPLIVNSVFLIKNIIGKIESHASGSSFTYAEEGGYSPVEYVISETVGNINTALS